MGCASSTVDVAPMSGNKAAAWKQPKDNSAQGPEYLKGSRSLTPCPRISPNEPLLSKRSRLEPLKESELRRPVGFDVAIGPMQGITGTTFDLSLRKSLPSRLARLEPVSGASILTAEMLSEKMKLAEEKRKKQLEKRANRKKNKLRKNQRLMEIKTEEMKVEIQERERLFEEKKKSKLVDVEIKQRILHEKADQVRTRAKQLRISEHDGMEFQMEKDQDFNAQNDDESWPDEQSERAAVQSQSTTIVNNNNNKDTSSHKSDSGIGSRTIHVEPINRIEAAEGDEEDRVKLSEDDGFFD